MAYLQADLLPWHPPPASHPIVVACQLKTGSAVDTVRMFRKPPDRTMSIETIYARITSSIISLFTILHWFSSLGSNNFELDVRLIDSRIHNNRQQRRKCIGVDRRWCLDAVSEINFDEISNIYLWTLWTSDDHMWSACRGTVVATLQQNRSSPSH